MADRGCLHGLTRTQIPMDSTNLEHRKYHLILLLVGMSLTLSHFILVHHVTIAMRQIEIGTILFTLSYFVGISLGYFISDRLSKNQLTLLLGTNLLAQMIMIHGSQLGFYVLSKSIGYMLACATFFLILSLFVTSFHAVFLPLITQTHSLPLRKSYSIEIVGSMMGLALVPLVAGVSHTLLLATYFVLFIALLVLTQQNKAIIFLCGKLVILFLLTFHHVDQTLATRFYKQWYSSKGVKQVIHTRYTPYHKIEVLRLSKERNMLVLNGQKQFAHGGHFNYSYFVAEYPAVLLGHPKVAVLGCGSMSTVGRIGTRAPSITIVELDRGVFETSKRFFKEYNKLDQLKNWSVVTDDAKHFLANTTETFDLILDDIPPARSRQIALTYTQEFFELVKSRLTPRGLFSMPSLTPVHAKSKYGKKVIATMASIFDNYFVLDNGDNAYFYGGHSSMNMPNKDELRDLVKHKDKEEVKIYTKPEVDELIKGTDIITINNMADLIYD
jgi:spermidine synthase